MPKALAFAQFQAALIRGSIDPVYLFEGEEPFFHDEGLRLLEKAVLIEGTASVDRESVRGGETSLAEILDLASTYPMSGARRLILVRAADGLKQAPADALKDYLARPNPRSCLVFSDPKLDGRRAFSKALKAGATNVSCAPLDEAGTAAWVRQRLRDRGFGISPELAEAIATGMSGDGLGRLDAELGKLMGAVGEPRPIEAADLQVMTAVPRVGDIFQVARRLVQGERGEAILGLRELLTSGEEPVKILGGLSWYFRNALRARVAADRRLPPREMTRLYGLDPWRVERLQREIGACSADLLRGALTLCLRADRELKGMAAGGRDPGHALERLMHQVGRGIREERG